MSLLDDLVRTDEPELIDLPATPPEVRARIFRTIDRFNRRMGLFDRALRGLVPLIEDARPGARAVRYLDLGCGEGGLVQHVRRWALRRGVPLLAAAVDVDRQFRPGLPNALRGDGRRLPLRDGAFDVVSCVLTLHHLAPDDAAALLREADRVAARALYLMDLRRSWWVVAAFWPVSRLLLDAPSHHDTMVSLRRGYTVHEVRDLAAMAGLAGRLHARGAGPAFWTAVRR